MPAKLADDYLRKHNIGKLRKNGCPKCRGKIKQSFTKETGIVLWRLVCKLCDICWHEKATFLR